LKRRLNLYRSRYEHARVRTRLRSYPFVLVVEPTNRCNLRCPYCFTGAGGLGRRSSVMSPDLFRKLMDELGGYLLLVGPDSRDLPLQASQAARVLTGASLPAGADSVVALQRCRVYGSRIWCPPLRMGEHINKRAHLLQRGQPVVSADKRLVAWDIDLLAAAGFPRIKVYRSSTA